MPRGSFGIARGVGQVIPPPMVARNIPGVDSRQLQDDNNALRRKLEELKKQVTCIIKFKLFYLD